MPKMKTHSGAKKRFRRTASGNIKCEGSRKTTPRKMNQRQRRSARQGTLVEGGMGKRISRMIGA